MIVARRLSGRGLGNLKNPSSPVGAIVPPLLGGALAIAGAYGMEAMSKPEEGKAASETQLFLGKWAPALGIAIGAAGGMAMYAMIGAPQGISAMAGSVVGGGALLVKKLADHAAMCKADPTAPGCKKSLEGLYGYGYGAVVPQMSNMQRGVGAIVMAPVAGRRRGMRGMDVSSMTMRNQAIGPSSGSVVTLSGINQAAFGTPGFVQG